MGGLPTPRVPSEIKDEVVTAKDGRIVDKELYDGTFTGTLTVDTDQLRLSNHRSEK